MVKPAPSLFVPRVPRSNANPVFPSMGTLERAPEIKDDIRTAFGGPDPERRCTTFMNQQFDGENELGARKGNLASRDWENGLARPIPNPALVLKSKKR
jgi:hypothetical protein